MTDFIFSSLLKSLLKYSNSPGPSLFFHSRKRFAVIVIPLLLSQLTARIVQNREYLPQIQLPLSSLVLLLHLRGI